MKTEFSKVTVNKRVDRVKKRKGRNKVRKPQETVQQLPWGLTAGRHHSHPQPLKGRRRISHQSKTESELEGCMGENPLRRREMMRHQRKGVNT